MAAEHDLDIDVAAFALGSPRLEDAVRIYATVFHQEWEPSLHLFEEQGGRRDFHGRVAVVDGTVVGMGFGARAEPGHWWYDGIADQVGADHPALQDAWNLVELAVLAEFRRRGIGTRLLASLLEAQPCQRALLSVIVANTPARAFYERCGFSVEGEASTRFGPALRMSR